MAELPEKKVLKNILLELKSRSLSSIDEMNKQQISFLGLIQSINSKFKSIDPKNDPNAKIVKDALDELFYVLSIGVADLTKILYRSQEDAKLYIKTLEEYSTELDNTLTQIFAQAQQQAEKEIHHMEELAKQTPTKPYSV